MRWMWDLVAPLACVGCGAVGDAELCPACAGSVAVLGRPWCVRCGTPTGVRGRSSATVRPPVPAGGRTDGCEACFYTEDVSRARSVVAFADSSRRLVLALKRRGRPGLARDIGRLLASLAGREGMDPDVVCWVPRGRSAGRAGFDHTELLARAVARRLGVPARPLLRRVAEGPRQADVPLHHRRTNVRGRFACRSARGHVLLVDDVLTTGATVETCASALVRAGAEQVEVVTWARTLRRRPRATPRPASILGG